MVKVGLRVAALELVKLATPSPVTARGASVNFILPFWISSKVSMALWFQSAPLPGVDEVFEAPVTSPRTAATRAFTSQMQMSLSRAKASGEVASTTGVVYFPPIFELMKAVARVSQSVTWVSVTVVLEENAASPLNSA